MLSSRTVEFSEYKAILASREKVKQLNLNSIDKVLSLVHQMYFIVIRKIHFESSLVKNLNYKMWYFVINFIIRLKSTINRQLSNDRLTFR